MATKASVFPASRAAIDAGDTMPPAEPLSRNDMQSIAAKIRAANHLIKAAETMAAKEAVCLTADARRIEQATDPTTQDKHPTKANTRTPNNQHSTPPAGSRAKRQGEGGRGEGRRGAPHQAATTQQTHPHQDHNETTPRLSNNKKGARGARHEAPPLGAAPKKPTAEVQQADTT